MEAVAENKNKWIALGLTLGVHALLFLLFIFIVFITPIPPFEIPEIQEVELYLGMEGMGDSESGSSGQNDQMATTTEATSSQTNPTQNSAPNIITDPDPTETSPYVPHNPNSKNKQDKVIEQKLSAEVENILNTASAKMNSKGKGPGTNGPGNGGEGTGGSPGNDTGRGKGGKYEGGVGDGNYDLKGRQLMKKPDQMTDAHEEGVVVVEIIVDETGKVIRATAGQMGSTTSSSNLLSKARIAAFSAKFNPSPTGEQEQRGFIKIIFEF